jgi:hypothetical protein
MQVLCEAIHAHSSLTELSVNWNDLGDAELEHLTRLISNNNTINTLRLYLNTFSEAAINNLTVAMEERNYGLIRLNLDHPTVQANNEAIKKICERNLKNSKRHFTLFQLLYQKLNYLKGFPSAANTSAKRGLNVISRSEPSSSNDRDPQKFLRIG